MSSVRRPVVQPASNQFIRPSTTSTIRPSDGRLSQIQAELKPLMANTGTYERFIRALESSDNQAIESLMIEAYCLNTKVLDPMLDARIAYSEAMTAARTSNDDEGLPMPGHDVKMDVDGNHSRPSQALVAGGDMMDSHITRDSDVDENIPTCVSIASAETKGTGMVSDFTCVSPSVTSRSPVELKLQGVPPRKRAMRRYQQGMKGLLLRFKGCNLSSYDSPPVYSLAKTAKTGRKKAGDDSSQEEEKDDKDKEQPSDDESEHSDDKSERARKRGGGGGGDHGASSISHDDEDDDGIEEYFVDLDAPKEAEMDAETGSIVSVDPWDIVWEGFAASIDQDKIRQAQRLRLTEAKRMGIHLATPASVEMYYALIEFCLFSSPSARMIVAYFDINSLEVMASFHGEDWETHFTRWQKVPRFNGKRYRLNANPLHKERLKVLAWFCHAVQRLRWRKEDVDLTCLKPSHFEDLKTQMKKEADRRLKAVDIPSREDLPSMEKKGMGSLSHLCVKVSQFLRSQYGESGLPLSYVTREVIERPTWEDVIDKPRANRRAMNALNFFDFENFDSTMIKMADILQPEYNVNVAKADKPSIREEYEKGRYDRRTAAFKRDEAVVLALISHIFKDTHAAKSYFPNPGSVKKPSGRYIFRNIKNNFLGSDYLRKEATALKEALRNAQYTGESKNYNWDTHVSKFMNGISQLADLSERLPEGISPLTADESINWFLDSIKDTVSEELKVARTVVSQDLGSYKDLASVTAKLRSSVKNWRGGYTPGGGKRNISSTQGKGEGGGRNSPPHKKPRGGGGHSGGSTGKGQQWGKLKLTADKKGVTGEIEALQYSPACYELFTDVQRAELRKARARKKQQAAAMKSERDERDVEAIAARVVSMVHKDADRDHGRSRSRHRSRSRSRSSSRDRKRDGSRSSRSSSQKRREAWSGRRDD